MDGTRPSHHHDRVSSQVRVAYYLLPYEDLGWSLEKYYANPIHMCLLEMERLFPAGCSDFDLPRLIVNDTLASSLPPALPRCFIPLGYTLFSTSDAFTSNSKYTDSSLGADAVQRLSHPVRRMTFTAPFRRLTIWDPID